MAGSKFRVAICGGGIGGLTLAVALSKCPNIEVDVYEAAQRFAEVGAGIGMWPRTWKIMEKMGLAEDLRKIAFVPPTDEPKTAFVFRKGDEPQGYTFQKLVIQGGLISYHRPDLQAVLLKHLSPTCRTYTSKRLVSYTQLPSSAARRICLQFHDGTIAHCDLLVGADGVKSAVRACMLRQHAAELRSGAGKGPACQDAEQEAKEAMRSVPPLWSGMVSYRTTIPSEVLRQRWPNHRVLSQAHLYLGDNSQMSIYPIGHGNLISISAFRLRREMENTPLEGPWVQEASHAELVQDFDTWEPEVQAVLDCVEKSSRWAVPTCHPLKSFISTCGTVVLLGDAAHAMLPFQGAGAGQAIEDAYILAALLTHPSTTLSTLPRASQIYDTVRRPFAQYVARVSRDAGLLYSLNYPGLTFPARRDRKNDRQRLEEIYELLLDNWRWTWEMSVEGDLARAVGMLEGRVVVS